MLLLAVALLVSCARQEYPAPLHAIDVTWQHPDVDFHLADPNGKARALADFRGKVKVVFFGYTHCPEVCPTTLADLAQVMRQLGPDAKNVQVLFVTLDPERDTPQVLGKFIPSFDPSFLGLYGDAQATAQAAQSFGVNYQKHPEKNGTYTLDHSDGTYLIGREGKPLWMSRYGQRTDFLVQDIRLLLAAPH
ncbi:MAG TPA: SCO family protein [Gallionellaceae bacterium]|nr:SCO family protein [Gallionellaceae bacterium]